MNLKQSFELNYMIHGQEKNEIFIPKLYANTSFKCTISFSVNYVIQDDSNYE